MLNRVEPDGPNAETQWGTRYNVFCDVATSNSGVGTFFYGTIKPNPFCDNGDVMNGDPPICIKPNTRNDPDKDGGCPIATDGNPIKLFANEKVQVETDSRGTAQNTLPIRRWYTNRGTHFDAEFGYNAWRLEHYSVWLSSNFDPMTNLTNPATVGCGGKGQWIRNNGINWSVYGCRNTTESYLEPRTEVMLWTGKRAAFHHESGAWVAEPDSRTTLNELWNVGVFEGWAFTNAKDETLIFDTQGVLQEIDYRNGGSETLQYNLTLAQGGDDDPKTLDRVDDHLGRSLTFTYANNRIDTIIDAQGEVYSYSYTTDNFLETVTYPDSDTDPTNNPVRQYHYNENSSPFFLWSLTGITDERGVRYANWEYEGFRAIASSHGAQSSGIDLVTVDYSGIPSEYDINGSVSTTNALGKISTFHYDTQHNSRRLSEVELDEHLHAEDASVVCSASQRNYNYDANGYLATVADWKGRAIEYEYDAQGREIERKEGLVASVNGGGTITTTEVPDITRTIITKWHPDFRLPTRVIELDRVVDTNYECGTGRVTSRAVYLAGSEPVYIEPSCSGV